MSTPLNTIIHADCLDILRTIPDNYFGLAIVDPPYGIGEDGGKKRYGEQSISRGFRSGSKYKKKSWDVQPGAEYFAELFRVSKNQIIWGANYFVNHLHDTRCMIVWDKKGADKSDFADAEIAWTSFDSAVRVFRYDWVGFGSINSGEKRIHPTQKPVALYRWLLQRYAAAGDIILDTHSGSGSCAVACHLEGFDFMAVEKDRDYWQASVCRLDDVRAQGRLFGA